MSATDRQEGREPRDLRLLVRVLTPVIITGLVLGAIHEYRRSARNVERRFGEKQVYLARQAADRLAEVFEQVRKLLLLIGDVYTVRLEHAKVLSVLQTVVLAQREQGAVAAAHVDGGTVAMATKDPVAVQGLLLGLPPCPEAQEMCLLGPTRSRLAPSGWALVASMGVRRAASERAGSVVLLLDWGVLQGVIVRATKLSPETYSWVLDHQGRLIMHPDHREQLGKPALEINESCAQCHVSFEVHRRMTAGESGSGRVQVRGGEPKLVVFTPFKVGHRRWSLAVATPAAQATAEARRSLTSILLFTGAILMVMVSGAALLDREASRRIRAAARFNRELEQKVAERTEEIERLYSRVAAMQAHHTRLERVAVAGEMAAIVAHEVRTPLNALSINAQMISRLLRREQPSDRDKAIEVLGTLQKEIERINALLEEHLLALVRHRPTQKRQISLNDVVNEAIRFIGPEGTRQSVQIVAELSSDVPEVIGDEAKLRQVLLNILLNAIQAMPEGGLVTLRTEQEGELASVRIQDTGPGIAGIAAEDVEQVFRPFMTTKEDGTGLGLAICARLMKEMGGKIRVYSRPGEGACFVVSLRISEEGDELAAD